MYTRQHIHQIKRTSASFEQHLRYAVSSFAVRHNSFRNGLCIKPPPYLVLAQIYNQHFPYQHLSSLLLLILKNSTNKSL